MPFDRRTAGLLTEFAEIKKGNKKINKIKKQMPLFLETWCWATSWRRKLPTTWLVSTSGWELSATRIRELSTVGAWCTQSVQSILPPARWKWTSLPTPSHWTGLPSPSQRTCLPTPSWWSGLSTPWWGSRLSTTSGKDVDHVFRIQKKQTKDINKLKHEEMRIKCNQKD